MRESITFSQDISDSLGEAARLDAIIIDFSKTFDLDPPLIIGCLKKSQPRAYVQGWSLD